jgi:sn-glycerol 3-phosphate transport system ATP-binding protein
MRVELQALHRRLGTTSLYVTHDQVEAMTLAHRMIVMNAGVAEQIGSPMDVYEDPATRFVAGFIGSPSMNFLAGKGAGAGKVALEHGGIVRYANGQVETGREIVVGIRPEHLTVADPADAMFAGTVEMVEQLGADTLVHISHGADNAIVRRPHGQSAAVGETLHVTAEPARVYLFDAASGQRLR